MNRIKINGEICFVNPDGKYTLCGDSIKTGEFTKEKVTCWCCTELVKECHKEGISAHDLCVDIIKFEKEGYRY